MTNEEAIKQIEYAIITGNINDVQCGALKKAIEALIVDAVPVVHCKYCVHRRESDNWCGVIAAYCGNLDWFCADGDKKCSD